MMGFWDDINPIKAVGDLLGGGSGATASSSQSVSTKTNVNIDLVPMAEILANSQIQTAKTDKETAQIELINAELERQQKEKTLKKVDTYIEHAKNGAIIFAIGGSLLYVSKKKRRK